jgi:hypothetical protein
VLLGVLALPCAAIAILSVAALAIRIGDRRCCLVSGFIGVVAGVVIGIAHIPYLSASVHGALSIAGALVAGEITVLLILGLRTAAALRLGLPSFTDDWFPPSPSGEVEDGDPY